MFIKEKSLKNRLPIFLLVIPLTAIVINCCVLFPVYTQIRSNISYLASALPDVFQYICLFIDIVWCSAQYASIIIVCIEGFNSKKSIINTVLICFGEIVVYHLLNITMSTIIDGSSITSGIGTNLLYIALETAQLSVLSFVSSEIFKNPMIKIQLLRSAARRLGKDEPTYQSEFVKYNAFYSKNNPVQHSALTGGIIYSSVRVIARLIFDFTKGAPQTAAETLEIVWGYSSDLICGVFVYILIILCCRTYYCKMKSK